MARLTLTLLTLASWHTPTQLPADGLATYYAPHVMEATYQVRLAYNQVRPCVECSGQIAMLSAADVGRKVLLEYRGRIYGPLLVVDCAEERRFAELQARGLVAEVSWQLAQELDMHSPLPVRILPYRRPAHGELAN